MLVADRSKGPYFVEKLQRKVLYNFSAVSPGYAEVAISRKVLLYVLYFNKGGVESAIWGGIAAGITWFIAGIMRQQ